MTWFWHNIIFNIKWHFKYAWVWYLFITIVLIATGFVYWGCTSDTTNNYLERIHQEYLDSERVKELARGKLVSLRNTGSFSIYDMELKFEDGSIVLMTYSFCRSNGIREGQYYQIWQSSIYGYRCKLLKEIQ